MTAIFEQEIEGYKAEVYYDEWGGDECNPRQWDNLGTMVCWYRDYTLGDKNPKCGPSTYLRGLAFSFIEDAEDVSPWDILREGYPMDYVWEIIHQHAVVLPLYVYEHSGITMNTTGFSCRWDSGQVGYIFVTNDKIVEEYGELTDETLAGAKAVLEAEVELYDAYITGQVYKWQVRAPDGMIVDSVGSYLGDDGLAYAKGEALSALKYQVAEAKKGARQVQQARDRERLAAPVAMM